MGKKIKIQSLVSGIVIVKDDTLRLRREWKNKGAIQIIDSDDLDILLYDPGVEYMFRQGVLDFVDEVEGKKFKVDFGWEQPGEEPEVIRVDDDLMREMMTEMNIADFRKQVKKLTKEQLFELTRFCIENNYTQYEKVEILKQVTDVDIINTIRLTKEDTSKK